MTVYSAIIALKSDSFPPLSGCKATQNRATQKYQKENLEQINFRVRKGEKQKYINAAAACGLSLAQFFISAANEKMEKLE